MHPMYMQQARGGLGVPSSGGGSVPGTGPGGINEGQLEPNSRARNAAAGIPYELVPAYPPFVRIANDPNVAYFPRFRSLTFGGAAVAAATTTQQIQFSLPTIVIARTGTGFMADNTGLPVGRTGLQLFAVQFAIAGSVQDLVDSGGGGAAAANFTVTADCVLGPAGLPSFFPGNGIFFDTGMFLNVTVNIFINNVQADITLWCLQEYGPARG